MNLTSQKKRASGGITANHLLSVHSLSGYRNNNFVPALCQKTSLAELTNVSPIKIEVQQNSTSY